MSDRPAPAPVLQQRAASGDLQGRQLTIGPEGRGLRRSLGPAAWVVLEELLLAAERRADGLSTAMSVRELARLTGLSKDTAARAMRRLIAADVVVRAYERRPVDGTFPTVAYLFRSELLIGLSVRSEASKPQARRGVKRDVQPALFPIDGESE